jgi:hypothetical protein
VVEVLEAAVGDQEAVAVVGGGGDEIVSGFGFWVEGWNNGTLE